MKASFVIVNYNRKEELLLTIAKTKDVIKDHRDEYEIVIVDNGSADGSAEAVEASHPDVVLIAKKNNIGAPAWNEGFAKAKGEYFIILDDDSHIESGLTEAIQYIDARPQIGILALNILTGPYTSAGWKMEENKNIVGFIGCGAIFRKKTYEQVGGYADWIFLYANEWELGMRCIDAGYQVQYFSQCKVIHRTSAVNRTNKRFDVFVTMHELSIIYKYFPQQRSKYMRRMVLNYLRVWIRLAQFKRAWYVLVGTKEFMKFKSRLKYTPVSEASQQLFINSFPPARNQPFDFITRRLGLIKAKFKSSPNL
jgi:GT2 family glycosyltransferase